MTVKSKLAERIPEWRERVRKLVKENGDVKVGDVTIAQVYGGMRGVRSLVTDISFVDPVEGIRFRGATIPEVLDRLPKPPGAEMPYVGGLYYLLLMGEFPTEEDALDIEREWKYRRVVPPAVFDAVRSMPHSTHPMTLLSMAVLALQPYSHFYRAYQEGMRKDDYWEPMLEDSLDLSARIPIIAAYIYQWKYREGHVIPPRADLDWAANFGCMLGVSDGEYADLLRMFLIIHSDHESGNASAHATHLVGSTLSDLYLAFSGGLNALAGPLHGMANQECVQWLQSVYERYGRVPKKEELHQFAWETLNGGQVIPGYGHAVLRKTDPRFIAQLEFGKKHFPDDPIFRVASIVYDVVPGVLQEQGKAKDPWPNVDAISGACQQHYGIKEAEYYTVMFGVSRLLGVAANAVWSRALGQPIERPKSLSTAMLEEIASK